MCGHVGIIGNLEHKDEATLKRLLLLDYFRGPDSTGVAAIRKSGETRISKLSSHPLDLFELPRYKAATSAYTSKAFLGHNRAATRGVVNSFNAHPYDFGHIVGAHNGTLTSDSHKALEKACDEKYPVDSMAIFACIAKIGIEETVKLLEGAWALVYYDATDNSVNFLRNKERPLWYCYDKEFKRLFYASEWPMMESAIKLAAQPYEMYNEPETNFRYFQFKENIHYKYNLEELIAGSAERIKPLAKELLGKEPALVKEYTPFTGGTSSAGKNSTATSSQTTTSTTIFHGKASSSRGKEGVDIIHSSGTILNPWAGRLTFETFSYIAKSGCSYCGEPIKWGETGMTYYEADSHILCPDCSTHSVTANRVYSKFLSKAA